jgi:asparagine N-glycosylation enzyme membrane subunit Stt3
MPQSLAGCFGVITSAVESLILRPRVNRIVNIALAIVYAATIIAGALGEWGYYIFGSGIEVALLAAIVYYAWTWPRQAPILDTLGMTTYAVPNRNDWLTANPPTSPASIPARKSGR